MHGTHTHTLTDRTHVYTSAQTRAEIRVIKTRQDKTRQRQDKTRQDKTGKENSGKAAEKKMPVGEKRVSHEEDRAEVSAASAIQAVHRGRKQRRELEEKNEAAAKMQASFRGKKMRDERRREVEAKRIKDSSRTIIQAEMEAGKKKAVTDIVKACGLMCRM